VNNAMLTLTMPRPLAHRIANITVATMLLSLAACSAESSLGLTEQTSATSAISSQYRGAAFILDVSTARRSVRVSAPTSGIVTGGASSISIPDLRVGPQLSLLGSDAIDVTASNYTAGTIGAALPGKVLVTFDLAVTNRLVGIRLVTPTFPTPPKAVAGVHAFPFEISVVTTSGGVSTSGNEMLVASPRYGAVIPSNDWNGEPHNFFNDVGCNAAATDCFRYEPFGAIAALGTSDARRVGFVVDPTVGDFRVRIILAADLQRVQ